METRIGRELIRGTAREGSTVAIGTDGEEIKVTIEQPQAAES